MKFDFLVTYNKMEGIKEIFTGDWQGMRLENIYFA